MPTTLKADRAAFTALFRQRRKNRAAIAERLARIAADTAGGFGFRCSADRDDAAAAAVLHALERVGRFDRNRARACAFAFFSALISNSIRDTVRSEGRRHRVRTLPEDDVGGRFRLVKRP